MLDGEVSVERKGLQMLHKSFYPLFSSLEIAQLCEWHFNSAPCLLFTFINMGISGYSMMLSCLLFHLQEAGECLILKSLLLKQKATLKKTYNWEILKTAVRWSKLRVHSFDCILLLTSHVWTVFCSQCSVAYLGQAVNVECSHLPLW